MDEKLFWQQKLIQYFHDPINKPYTGYSKIGSQKSFIKKYSDLFLEKELYLARTAKPADWTAASADRAYFYTGKDKPIHWYSEPLVFHPLAGGYPIRLSYPGLEPEADANTPKEPLDSFAELKQVVELQQDEIEKARETMTSIHGWNSDVDLKKDYFVIWRRLREELTQPYGKGNLVWEMLPADTRSPDHSIWDHIKVTAALNFMLHDWGKNDGEPTLPESRAPWMLRMGIGPVGHFLSQARTGRDLWISSYLLSELMWQAIQVVAEHYGPDAIVYPDLNGNPRADCWLMEDEERRNCLPENYRSSTFAAVIPNNFVALVPRGGEGYLTELQSLAKDAQDAVNSRWQALQKIAFDYLDDLTKKNGLSEEWKILWQRQHKKMPLRVTWAAIPWLAPDVAPTPDALEGIALPAQQKDIKPPEIPEEMRASEMERRLRLEPWVPPKTWDSYAQTRRVFVNTGKDIHNKTGMRFFLRHSNRGFDYAITHHQLSVRHGLRNQVHDSQTIGREGGEKCTLCHEREALPGTAAAKGTLLNLSQTAREFWRHLNPDGEGSDRLCGVCAMKRFLVEAGLNDRNKEITGLTPLWSGYHDKKEGYSELIREFNGGPRLRLPFPSVSAIAAQKFLASLHEYRGQLEAELGAVARACKQAECPPTAFPEALTRLHHISRESRGLKAGEKSNAQRFFEYDPQDTLFPNALDGEIRRYQEPGNKDGKREQALRDQKRAVSQLLDRYRKLTINNKDAPVSPATRIAVIKLDGDRMGALLRGDAEAIGATWEQIIHPEMVARIKDPDSPYHKAGWPELLNGKRLMGPSLHAFISRAMAAFVHRIVPWVVEREFGGRLVYAGGDDVLCLAPAADALDMTARLQQLWSAPWVLDSREGQRNERENSYISEWDWRLPDWKGEFDTELARCRFAIPDKPDSKDFITLPITEAKQLCPHVCEAAVLPSRRKYLPPLPLQAPVIPMPAGSLSAAIVYGHFKSHLGNMISEAEALLEEWAKGKADRGAVAVSLRSRNGPKAQFAMKWNHEEEVHPSAHRCLDNVINGFIGGKLPGRLPYKLRENAAMVANIGSEDREQLMRGLLDSALETGNNNQMKEDLLSLWRQGFELHAKEPERSVEGMLFCRAMASSDSEEEED